MMRCHYLTLWACIVACLRCEATRIANFRHLGMPLCTVVSRPKDAEDAQSCLLLVLPEKGPNITIDNKGNKDMAIGKHKAVLHDNPTWQNVLNLSEGQNASGIEAVHDILLVRNQLKIGINQLKEETIFDKRNRQSNILDLAKIALKTDGLVVMLDYSELVKKGPGTYQLKLLDAVLFTLRQFCTIKLDIHFLIYGYETPHQDGGCNQSFEERKLKEIEEVLTSMVKKDPSDMISVSFDFSPEKDQLKSIEGIHGFVERLTALKRQCQAQLQKVAGAHEETIGRIGKLQEYLRSSINDVSQNLKGVDLSSEAPVLVQLLQQANALELSFSDWMRKNGVALGEIPTKLKEEVDQLVGTLLGEFDAALKSSGTMNQRNVKVVRKALVDSLQTKLAFLMDGIILKLQDAVLQEFQKHIQTLPVDENLDLNLQDAIAKFDKMFYRSSNECTFDLLKVSPLYKTKAEMQRRDVIENMKEVCNHVLEYAIGKGLFYAKFSPLDGIPYISSNFLVRSMKKLINKLKIPLHITLNYLSPTAFGLSNMFRDKIPLKPGIVRYFTGDKKHEMFSADEATRRRANSLVRNH